MNNKGFTLLEIVIVLLILGLLLAGLLGPLSTSIDQKQRQATQEYLEEIREALLGYALVNNGLLPCPSTVTDPANANYGMPDSTCTAALTAEGFLPWKVLGVPEVDSWGRPRTNSSDPINGLWRYRVDRLYTNPTNPISLSSTFTDNLSIVDSAGNSLIAVGENPIAIIFSGGNDLVANGENATFDTVYESNPLNATYDDMMIWLTRPVLFYRLVQAGRLP